MGFIDTTVSLPYRIDFENEPTATAPAQIVTVTDQLDADLDWNTFALTEIGFGDVLIAVPPGAQHFETRVPVNYNGRDFEVQIVAGINLTTGQVFARFYSIDPATGLPPDVLTGFLPPEDGTGRGMGHFSYIVNQKPGLPTGRQIKNIALISFDGQPVIATNQVDPHDPSKGVDPAKEALNTIDAAGPASAVQPLPATSALTSFTVTWAGTDDAGGSGIANFDVYSSTDSGAFVRWQDHTTSTSATFTGQAGHSYAFYSVARDNVGHVEAAPAVADASIRVVATNVAPVANNDSASTPEDTPVVINVIGNDTDADGNGLTPVIGTGPAHGSVVLNANGSVTYTPAANYFGPDSFTYRASDGLATSNLASVTLTITPVNDAPVAVNDSATTPEDTAVVLNLAANDTDVELDTLSVTAVTTPLHGTAVLNAGGSVTYTPAANYFGTDAFSYTVSDGHGGTAVGAVNLTVTSVNDPPTLAAIADKTVNEGSALSFGVIAIDPDPGALTYSLDTGPAGAAINPTTGVFSWTPADGPGSAPVTVRVTDAQGAFDTKTFNVAVANVAPTLTISGAGSVAPGVPYTLTLSATDPGQETISQWLITWGDGAVQTIAGNPPTVTHSYLATGSVTISASATDEDGTFNANTLVVSVTNAAAPKVTSFTPTSTGFRVTFDHAIDPTVLNLYATQTGGQGAADVTLTGARNRVVTGSMALDADAKGLTFIRTGGVLAADTYTVRLVSGAKAFRDAAGNLLDGNGDGTGGDSYVTTFTIAAPGRTVSVPDFMRGPGQGVDLTAPSRNGFLPVTLSNGSGVRSVEFTLKYDPTKLTIEALLAGPNLPRTATIERLAAPDGTLKVRITSPTAFNSGLVHLLNIKATVPTTAAYGSKEILDLDGVLVNGSPAVGNDALHLVGYFGDASGNAAYSALDVQQLVRVIGRLDSGFAAYPNVDPVIIGDIAGGGTLDLNDSLLLTAEVSFLTGAANTNRLEVPPIPPGIGPIRFSGPDPLVDMPSDLAGRPGEVIAVPVRLDTAVGLESAQLRIGYDTSRFELVQVKRGSLTGDFDWFVSGSTPGRINIDMARLDALDGGTGTLLRVDLRIKPGAASGTALIDLQWASLNDGHLTLGTAPQLGADPTDGKVSILGALAATLASPQTLQPGALIADGALAASVPAVTVLVIDFSTLGLRAAGVPAIVPSTTEKPWLKDFLFNAGQPSKPSPNLGMKVTLPVARAVSVATRA